VANRSADAPRGFGAAVGRFTPVADPTSRAAGTS
jgi:hypothetical protein